MNGNASERSNSVGIAQRRVRWADHLGARHKAKPVQSRIQSLVESVAGSMGYAIIPRWRLRHYELAEHLKRLFGMLEVDCVLDVGANRGQYRDFLRAHVGYRGVVVSFEPISENVRILMDRATADDRWTIMALALGGEDGTAKINVTAATEFSSFLMPNDAAPSDVADLGMVQRTETVQIRRLDSIFQELIAAHRAKNLFLKMDTQGYEIDILRGARCSLERTRGLQSEVSVIPLYEGVRHHLDCIAYMEKLGFHVTGMFPVSRDQLLRVVDFDCVMRRLDLK